MTKNKPVEIWIQLAALALVISAGSLYVSWKGERSLPSSQPMTGDVLPVPVPADWKVFIDPVLHQFAFKFPPHARVVKGAGEGLYLDEPIDMPTPAFSVVFPRVDTFSENGSHGYYESRVRVFVGVPEFGCNPKAAGSDSFVGQATVAGRDAYIFDRDDAGVGNRMQVRRYAFCGDDQAFYSIEDIFASGSDGTPLTPKLEADIEAQRESVRRIINSFEFL